MIERAFIRVGGPDGAGKTTFIEALLGSVDAWTLACRCVRDDTLRQTRESAPARDPELARYHASGASGAARFAFPRSEIGTDAFFMTDLMEDPSDVVLLEGDSPLAGADLEVFIAPPLPDGEGLFVRRTRDRASERRVAVDALRRRLGEPDGVSGVLEEKFGGAIAQLARANPALAEEARTSLLEGIARVSSAPPPAATEYWAVTASHAGIEGGQLVVINVRDGEPRGHAERVIRDLARLRKEDDLFGDILGARGTRIPITAVVADLRNPKDAGRRKAIRRVKRAI